MIKRAIRISLTLLLALLFTGRMEAAAGHCARLAQEQSAPVADAPPCHGARDAAKPGDQPAQHQRQKERCECVGVLKAYPSIAAAGASGRIEPYLWARPEAALFTSVAPKPALRPPIA